MNTSPTFILHLLLFCRARPPQRTPSLEKISGCGNTAAPPAGQWQLNHPSKQCCFVKDQVLHYTRFMIFILLEAGMIQLPDGAWFTASLGEWPRQSNIWPLDGRDLPAVLLKWSHILNKSLTTNYVALKLFGILVYSHNISFSWTWITWCTTAARYIC